MIKIPRYYHWFMIGVLSLMMSFSGCKKEKDDPEPPKAVNLKHYIGTTEQDLTVSLGTAEIQGTLYLMSFSIDLIYHDTVHQSTYQEILSKSISTGIIPFTGSSFQYNETMLSLSGTLDNGDMNLSGSYTWKYDGTNTHSGPYNTVKQ